MAARLCRQCGAAMRRGGKSWKEYRQRVFCSIACKSDFERIDSPPHDCAACGGPVERRQEETTAEHAARRYCSRACAIAGATAELPERLCAHCGERMERTRYPNGSLEGAEAFLRRTHCSRECRAASGTRGSGVSERQNRTRARAHRAAACEGCGSVDRLDVHHVDRNIDNNVPDNLQTLCHECHVCVHKMFDACGVETGLIMPRLTLDNRERLC